MGTPSRPLHWTEPRRVRAVLNGRHSAVGQTWLVPERPRILRNDGSAHLNLTTGQRNRPTPLLSNRGVRRIATRDRDSTFRLTS